MWQNFEGTCEPVKWTKGTDEQKVWQPLNYYNNSYCHAFPSLLQFCNNCGFVATSGIIILFCPLLDDWLLCRPGVTRFSKLRATSCGPINARTTSLIHTFEIKVLLKLPSIILVLIFVNVKTLTTLMLFSEQACRRPGACGHHFWPLM